MRFPRDITIDAADPSKGVFRLEGAADVDRVVRALHIAIDALEEIGLFAPGRAGDAASDALIRLKVWGEGMRSPGIDA